MATKNPLEHIDLGGDSLIMEVIPVKDEKTKSGFTVPADVRARSINIPKYGNIARCGPEMKKKFGVEGKTLKQGDMVSFMFYSGTPLEYDGKQYLIMREFDVQFIINKK